jgi:hypothetical protein
MVQKSGVKWLIDWLIGQACYRLFLDQTWFHPASTICWQDGRTDDVIRNYIGQRLTVLHDGSKTEFVSGAYPILKSNTRSSDYNNEISLKLFPVSQVGIPQSVYGLRAGRSGFESRQGQGFSLLHNVQTGFGAHSASYPMDAGGSFPRGKAFTSI